MSFDLTALPKPKVIEEIDYEAILGEYKQDLGDRHPPVRPVLQLESAVTTKTLQTGAYRETLVRARVNEAARANLLAFAEGSDLDHLAAFYDVVRLPGELDDRLRLRVVFAIQGRSTGGTEPRYRGIALSASLRVADARVYRIGRDPTVNVAVYAADNNGVADAALIATVEAALNDPAVRMVNDTIVIRSAVFRVVDVEADIWLLPETPDTVLSTLETTLREAWMMETGLGFDLPVSWLTARLMRPGVYNVRLISPGTDEKAPPHEALAIGAIKLNLKGRDY